MKTFFAFALLMAATMMTSAAQPAASPNGPKNLVSPTYRAPVVKAEVHRLSSRELKRLTASAETPADHLRIARYYLAEANILTAKGESYEHAAATYRKHPSIKNNLSPTTAARYEYLAKELREKATSDRMLAASHEQMAGTSAGL